MLWTALWTYLSYLGIGAVLGFVFILISEIFWKSIARKDDDSV